MVWGLLQGMRVECGLCGQPGSAHNQGKGKQTSGREALWVGGEAQSCGVGNVESWRALW